MGTITDLYPSRVGRRPERIGRKDPVVYTTGAEATSGPLPQNAVHSFEEKGYLFFDRFFSEEETGRMKQQLDHLSQVCAGSSAPEVILEPEGDEVRSVFAVHRDDAFFKTVSQEARLRNIVRQLLGSDVYIHQSRINFKPGFHGTGFYWHSDFETWHVEDGMPNMRAISCSIALSDNHVYNGPLMVIPGSHKTFVSCAGQTPEGHYKHSLRAQELGVPDEENLDHLYRQGGIDMPVGPAGSVLFFECNIMHASANNLSPVPRSNLFFVFNSVENQLVDPYCGLQPRPEFIAHRKDII